MATLKMYGGSDDLVESEGIPGCDEFNCYDEAPRFLVETPDASLSITAVYHGSWAFAVGSADRASDYHHMPEWPITRTWGADTPYSETLRIDVPDNATLRRMKGESNGS